MGKLSTSAKTRPGADCGSDHELLIAIFRLKLKKVGKTTRPSRYDLDQIPYEYIVEVTNILREWDSVDRVPEELCTEVCNIVHKAVNKPIPKEKKCKKAKCFSEETLQIAEKRKETKSKGERERYTKLNAEFQRIARRGKKAFFSEQCKEIRKTIEKERLDISSRKTREIKRLFHARLYDIYCHSVYLTYMQSTSYKMLGWMTHKLESRWPGETSTTSDMQMIPPFWQKVKRNSRAY